MVYVHKVLFSRYGKSKEYTLADGTKRKNWCPTIHNTTRSFQKFADYLFYNNVAIGYGHRQSYYKNYFNTKTSARGYGVVNYLHSTEAFAQYTALSNTKNKKLQKLMNYFAPNTTKIFDEIMDLSVNYYNGFRRSII